MKVFKLIKNVWREIALVILIAVFVTLMYTFAVNRPTDMYAQSFILIGIAVSAVLIVLLLKSLWRSKWKRAAAQSMQKLFAKLQRFFEKLGDKLGIKRSEKKSVLGGRIRIKFEDPSEKIAQDEMRKEKNVRWKQLNDGRARMRYLYRALVTDKIKHGASIFSTQTPDEIAETHVKTPAEKQLFEMYSEYRYDERRAPSDEDVKSLKEEMGIK